MSGEATARKKPDLTFYAERIGELPTLPSIVYELSRIISDPMSSTAEVQEVMEKDQSMTTKVLRLVNSAYYAIPGGVTQISRAIAFLGFDTVNQLVLSSSILNALQAKAPLHFDLQKFWIHALGVGMAAETIAKITKQKVPADLFTAGLVHDIGKVALCMISPEDVNRVAELAKSKSLTFIEAEYELGLPGHTTLGALIAKKWNLPLELQTCIEFHHDRDTVRRRGISQDPNRSVDTVFLANVLVHALKFGNSGHEKIIGAPKVVLERLGIPQENVPALAAKIRESLNEAENFLRIIQGS